MTVEKFMLDADGKRILDADGKQAIHEDCCCGADTCSCCGTDTTPLTFEVVFSGVLRCLGGTSSGINGGTYTLTQDASNSCLWSLDTTVDGYGVTMTLWATGGECTWHLLVEKTSNPHVPWYEDSSISSFSCATGASSTNDHTGVLACDKLYPGEGGYGGSATITVP